MGLFEDALRQTRSVDANSAADAVEARERRRTVLRTGYPAVRAVIDDFARAASRDSVPTNVKRCWLPPAERRPFDARSGGYLYRVMFYYGDSDYSSQPFVVLPGGRWYLGLDVVTTGIGVGAPQEVSAMASAESAETLGLALESRPLNCSEDTWRQLMDPARHATALAQIVMSR